MINLIVNSIGHIYLKCNIINTYAVFFTLKLTWVVLKDASNIKRKMNHWSWIASR